MKNKKTPDIRFKGFTDDWEQRKLFDCIDKILDFRGRTPKKLGMDWSDEGYLALSALNVKDGYIDFSQDVHYGNQVLYDKWMTGNELHKGQVLFTTEAPMGNVAQVPDGKKYILSQRTIAFLVKNNIVTEDFFAVILRSPKVRNELLTLQSGGTAKGVSQKSLSFVKIELPRDLKEQVAIAQIFHDFDNLITLHQRKLEKLKNFKKAMLEKMFPKNGEKTPEIRFQGFTDDWEQRKFSDVIKTRRGLTYKPTDVTEIGIRVLRSSNINEDCFEIHDDDVFVNEDVVNIPYAKNGDILITSANGSSRLIGKHAIIHDIQEKSIVHGGFMLIASSDEPEFINASMSSPWYTKFINVFVSGGNGAIGNLSKADLDEQHILIPCKEERKKIGSYFSNLDNLITLHQRKLEKLQQIKKAMLEKMFV